MNPRIKLLAEQAGVNLSSFQFSGTPTKYEVAEQELQKFAELIVRECAFVAQNKDAHKDWLKYGRGLAAGKILEHFGVEA